MNGLLAHCRREGLLDKGFLDGSVAVPEGFLEGIDIGHDLESVADTCDLPPADLQRFFDLFAATPRTVTLFSQGINQSLRRSEEHTSELQSLMRISYAVFCLKKKKKLT